MITDIANWLGQAVVAELIGGSESEGWYALKDMTLMRWNRSSQEILETALQWPDYPLSTETSMHALIGNTYVLGGKRQNNTGPSRIRFAEFDAATGQMVPGSEYENGDGLSRWGAGCRTDKGGFVGVVYVDVQPKNTIVLDVFYRRPAMPPIPGTTPPPKWWYERRSLSATTQSGIYDYLQVVQGPDGLIWIFVMRDSAGTIALLRYRPTLTGLEYVDDAPEFIPRNLGHLSPSGESPRLAAVVDKRNNRIVLCYQGAPDTLSDCLKAKYGNEFAGHWSITEVGMDKQFRLLGSTPWWAAHAGDEQSLIVARPDGVYFMLPYVNPVETCAEEGFHLGTLVNGEFRIALSIPRGSILGRSQDGWCFYLDRTAKPFPTTYLMRVCCAPVMSIRRSDGNIIVDWEPFTPGDMLQEKLDVTGASWETPFVCVPPATLAPSSSSKIYRVVQGAPVTG
jgi:hypothetical protein